MLKNLPWRIRQAACVASSAWMLAILFPPAIRGAEYYVDKDSIGGPASDSEAGTKSAPWQTISKANRSAEAGDTVFIRKGTYKEAISPRASGTEAKRITFQAFPKEKVTLTGVRHGIVMKNCAYVTVDGIVCDKTGEYVMLDNSHHIWIKNCTFDNAAKKDGWPVGVVFRQNAHHNWIDNCRIGRVGYSTSNDDKGGVMNIGNWARPADKSYYNLIENCTFSYGGHHIIELAASYNVIRNNYFHNEEWMKAPHRKETGGKAGNRHIIIDGSPTNVARNLLEGNIFAFSGLPPDQDGSSGVSVRTPRNIIRRNIFYHNDTAGLNFASFAYSKNFFAPHDVRFNNVYHNVFFHNAYAAKMKFAPLLYGLTVTKFGGPKMTDLSIKNNIFWRNNGKRAISFYHVDRARQDVSHNWEESGDPRFVNDETPPDPLKPKLLDFHLQVNSPCIDKGGWLTTISSPSGTGKSFTVENANYFMDGWDIVQGDVIQLQGGRQRVRITRVDYEKRAITVDKDLKWTRGLGVSLAYVGSAPDIGAYEYGQSSTGISSPRKASLPKKTGSARPVTPAPAPGDQAEQQAGNRGKGEIGGEIGDGK